MQLEPPVVLHPRPVAVLVLQGPGKNGDVSIPPLGIRQSPLCAKIRIDVEEVSQGLSPVVKYRHRQKIGASRVVYGVLEDLHPAFVRHKPPFQVVGKPVRSGASFPVERVGTRRVKHIAIQDHQS